MNVLSSANDAMDCRPPASSVRRFPRQEYWGRLPFPSPDLPHPGIKHMAPVLVGRLITAETSEKLLCLLYLLNSTAEG